MVTLMVDPEYTPSSTTNSDLAFKQSSDFSCTECQNSLTSLCFKSLAALVCILTTISYYTQSVTQVIQPVSTSKLHILSYSLFNMSQMSQCGANFLHCASLLYNISDAEHVSKATVCWAVINVTPSLK